MEVKDWSTTDNSNTLLGSISLVEGVTTIDQGNDIPRAIMGAVARQLGDVGVYSGSIASAATTNLATATGWLVTITGTTTITSFGTVAAGQMYVLLFSGALTLTHNATSLILPGAANITTSNGDFAIMMSYGSGNWRCISYSPSSGTTSGAVSSTDNAVVRFHGTSGNQIQNSGVIISDTDIVVASGFRDAVVAATVVNHAITRWSSATGQLEQSVATLDDTGSIAAVGFVRQGYIGGDTVATASFLANVGSSAAAFSSYADSTSGRTHQRFQNTNGNIGSITTNGSATQFNTSSDGRLKINRRDFNSGDIIDATNVCLFDWTTDQSSGYGVIAQDAMEVFPQAISHDEAADVWSVDYSKYVPVLLREVKELRTRLAALEA